MSSNTASSHLKYVTTSLRVDALVTRGWKSAPATLIKMLHDKDTGPYVLRRLTEGSEYQFPAQSVASASTLPFAHKCMLFGRDDIVRAVTNAGVPTWLAELPDAQRPKVWPNQFTPQAWLFALCCRRMFPSKDLAFTSVLSFASRPLHTHSGAFIELAIEIDPNYNDVCDPSRISPEDAAMVMELLMTRRIAAASASAAASPSSAAAADTLQVADPIASAPASVRRPTRAL